MLRSTFNSLDHGENMVSLHHYLKGSEFQYETTLGTFFLILPENNKHYNYNVDNIRINQQRFITPYDIHDTLIHICFNFIPPSILEEGKFNYKANNAFSGKGESVFNGITQEDRFCTSKFNYIMASSDCKCKLW